MSKVTATAKIKNEETGEVTEREASVEYDFGEDVNSMINELGADVVFQHCKSSITVALQNALRTWMQADHSDAEIQGEKVNGWVVPSGRSRTANKMGKLKEMWLKLSVEEREEVLGAE